MGNAEDNYPQKVLQGSNIVGDDNLALPFHALLGLFYSARSWTSSLFVYQSSSKASLLVLQCLTPVQ